MHISIKIIHLIIIFLFCIISCNKDKEPNPVYYKFTDEDLTIMPLYRAGQSLTFKNQDNDEMIFKVFLAQHEKKQEYYYSFPGEAALFFYDEFSVVFEPFDGFENTPAYFCFNRKPIDEEAYWDFTTEYPSEFNAVLRFKLWNGRSLNDNIWDNRIILLDYDSIISLDLNNTYFDDVKVYKSNNNEPNVSFGYIKNVHKLYYVYNYGIIGFDDLDGNEWRLK